MWHLVWHCASCPEAARAAVFYPRPINSNGRMYRAEQTVEFFTPDKAGLTPVSCWISFRVRVGRRGHFKLPITVVAAIRPKSQDQVVMVQPSQTSELVHGSTTRPAERRNTPPHPTFASVLD
ncbi:hypothetical protein EDB87DRAFT_440371 [Lactarius vividus]|nr:hypothetical protein EDB87DRAFT_440371 [Lactarius vividus]